MISREDIFNTNQQAWDQQSRDGSEWCKPIAKETLEQARKGIWSVILTPNKSVPAHWFGNIREKNILCLASGGGQQAPILAAAGANVISFDLSEQQLEKDKKLAELYDLSLKTVQGNMIDLSVFDKYSFDLIFHPIANLFVPELQPVWQGCHRILKSNGILLSGFMNPYFYLFDHELAEKTGKLTVKYRLPYSDLEHLNINQIKQRMKNGEGIEFSHSLDAQIGGQLKAGFVIDEFYEDNWQDTATPLNQYANTSMATRAIKIK